MGYSVAHGSSGALIGFDMGGTSTDVSRFDGTLQHFYSATIAGVKIQVCVFHLKFWLSLKFVF